MMPIRRTPADRAASTASKMRAYSIEPSLRSNETAIEIQVTP
jgi:hypothetical protein